MRGTDSEPKELFVYHQAGLAGMGGSSYIDSVAFRERDMTNGWTGSADGTREQRHYYAQPPRWRADVSAIFDNAGAVMEWQKYSSYGVPYLITPGDHNKDGVVDSADEDAFDEDYKDGVVSRADLNKDGAVTSADQTLFTASYAKATVGGRWKLSATSIGSRKGYAGYEHEGFGNDLAAPELAHVRHRVLHFELGRWIANDTKLIMPGPHNKGGSRRSAVDDEDVSYELCPSFMCANPCSDPRLGARLLCFMSRPCLCICDNNIEDVDPRNWGVRQCVIEHELVHYDEAECRYRPYWDVRPGRPYEWPCFEDGRWCTECRAYQQELRCLTFKLADCIRLPVKDMMDCMLTIASVMRSAYDNAITYCGACYGFSRPGTEQDTSFCTVTGDPPADFVRRPPSDLPGNWPPDLVNPKPAYQ